MKELDKKELKKLEGGTLHTIMYYLGLGYQRAIDRGYSVDIGLTFY